MAQKAGNEVVEWQKKENGETMSYSNQN